MKKVECVIFDWAGTTVDYGCFAPVAAFIGSFKSIGIDLTMREARLPMGLTKIDHVRALFSMERVAKAFKDINGRDWNEDDVNGRYLEFKERLFATLADYATPMPGTLDTVAALRKAGLKIGSTTGYTAEMMNVVLPSAEKQGYKPDNCVTSDNLPAGRPYPYMIYKNMCDLAVPARRSVVKCGDTVSDIREGVNAGVWTVGIVTGSNELGLSEEEVKAMPADELSRLKLEVRMRFCAAGADYVIDNITELPQLIEAINKRMEQE